MMSPRKTRIAVGVSPRGWEAMGWNGASAYEAEEMLRDILGEQVEIHWIELEVPAFGSR